MSISRLAIRRPVTTLMMVLMVLLLGAVSLSGISIDLLPEMSFPVVVVITRYEGAGPLEVENLITRPVEEAVGSVGNLKRVSSETQEGLSTVIAEFEWGTSMDAAAMDIREKVDMIRRYLPDGATDPMIIKADPSAMPIMQISVSGTDDLTELTRLVEDVIKKRLERIEGVAMANVLGGVRQRIEVTLNPVVMEGYALTPSAVLQALRMENLNMPGGVVEEAGRRIVVRTIGEFSSLEDISRVRVNSPLGMSVALSEIAHVELVESSRSQIARLNGRPSVGVYIQKQSGANTVQIAGRVRKVLQDLSKELPPGVTIEVAEDQSQFIGRSIRTVANNAVTGGVLAVLILLGFLQNVRTTIVIGLAIPISIISTFILMYFSGLTLNLMSLGGLALGVGMLVDNAIVVLENISRHREAGLLPAEAAATGAEEVGMAVTASTLTTIVVFLPILFITGLASQLFRQLAVTVSFSLLASLIVSLTFVPMLYSQVLGSKGGQPGVISGFYSWFGRNLDRLIATYRRWLGLSLKRRAWVVSGALISVAAAVVILDVLPSEFIPKLDRGEIRVDVLMPQGTVLSETDQIVQVVENTALSIKEVEAVFARTGSRGSIFGGSSGTDVGSVSIRLKRAGRSTAEVAEELRKAFGRIPGAEIRVTAQGGVAGEESLFGAPIDVIIKGDDLAVLNDLAGDIASLVSRVEGTREVKTSVGHGLPEMRVVLNRDLLSHFGLSTAYVGSTVKTAVSGETATRARMWGTEMDVVVVYPEADRKDPASVAELAFLSPQGARVSLADMADIQRVRGPSTIVRQGQVRMVSVTASVSGRDLGSVMEDVERAVGSIRLPYGYTVEFGGETREMREAFGSLTWALALSVVLVYMVLAAQFESLVHPFTIMTTVPVALVGAVFALFITGRSLNVTSLIGIITLAGIVVNNAIVFVDYLLQQRRRGMERTEAILHAGVARLRPILMTSITTILGLAPLAVGRGRGGELQAPLATAIIGGMSLSTLLTLFLIPAVYTYFDDLATGIARLLERRGNP